MLPLVLLSWPFAAVAIVLFQGRRGHAAVPPFAVAAATAFVVTGILLVMALTTAPDVAIRFLFFGTATFGGAILSALSAMALSRYAARAYRSDDDPGGMDPT